MTIEEEFFKTFGIEPKDLYGCSWDSGYPHPDIDCKTCGHWDKYDTSYPEITDRILLELICIASSIYPITINRKETYHELKDFILGFFIRHRYNKEMSFKQVRSLFEV